MNISQDKWSWREIIQDDGFKFLIPEHVFQERFVGLVGQHLGRIFSFNQSETYNLDADFYYHSKQGKKYCSSRFMLVCDYKYTLNVLKNEDSILTGNYSNDKTYAKIISEHIHQDIYLDPNLSSHSKPSE